MSRHSYVPGISLHVIRRGNNRMSIFHDHTDRYTFLKLMKSAARKSSVSIHGFVLMDTHYHFLATPPDEDALPRAMKMLGECYVRHFNRKYQRVGTLWTGRYQAKPVSDERYWLTCLRYIEQNPVRAKMVPSPDAYRWSSYCAHGLGQTIDWLVEHPLYLALGRTPRDRHTAYRAICGVPLTDEELVEQRTAVSGKRSDLSQTEVRRQSDSSQTAV